MTDTLREAVAQTLCHSRKFETGEGCCAPICMENLGDARPKCTRHVRVHGALVDAILAAIREQKQAIVPDFVLKMLWEAFPWGAGKSELMEVEMKEHIRRWEND